MGGMGQSLWSLWRQPLPPGALGPGRREMALAPLLGAQQGGRWVCVLLDLFPSHLYLPLVTRTGRHCQSHLGEVTALPN